MRVIRKIVKSEPGLDDSHKEENLETLVNASDQLRVKDERISEEQKEIESPNEVRFARSPSPEEVVQVQGTDFLVSPYISEESQHWPPSRIVESCKTGRVGP